MLLLLRMTVKKAPMHDIEAFLVENKRLYSEVSGIAYRTSTSFSVAMRWSEHEGGARRRDATGTGQFELKKERRLTIADDDNG